MTTTWIQSTKLSIQRLFNKLRDRYVRSRSLLSFQPSDAISHLCTHFADRSSPLLCLPTH
ncbi:MAG: hypothetical protein KME16_21135 [Scytolyngbya sp. HA4215-MV1]|nr:hypothetical protein [Scytolyngbya sp. HA4215-MV1]